MKYIDRVYGEVEITDNVIVDIINTDIFKRLGKIDQAGYFQIYFPDTQHSRFEHSIGCYLLLKKFTASIEEQLNGLLHDVSHSAFSHTADYVFEGGRGEDHNYQDDIFETFVRQTEIPNILVKHGFDVDYILDENNFPLQETDLPNLCADRIDYSLRGAVVYGIINKNRVDILLNNLEIIENKWVFKNFEYAWEYAQIFKKLNDIYYSGKETAAMFLRTSKWIKYAINKKYITPKELFTTDNEVIEKINTYKKDDKILGVLWKKMNNSEIVLGKKGENDVEKVVVKSRVIDPLFCSKNNIKHISDFDQKWKNIIKKEMQPKIYYLKM